MIDLNAIFGKFAGREVPMKETEIEYDFDMLGKMTLTEVAPADENDPVIREMRETAQKHGLTLRLFWPGLVGSADYRTDRVNANILQEPDGTWRIDSMFSIG